MISENLKTLAETKQNIKLAIEAKGQDLTNVPFTQYAEKIEAIQTGGGENKLAKLVSGAYIEITASDLGNIQYIGDYGFYQKNITNIELPNSLTIIGNSGFSTCKQLKSITIPDNVTTIGTQAFYNCTALEYIKLSEKLTKLSNSMFASCALKEIEIPASVTSLGSYTFSDCKKLEKVVFKGQAPNFSSGFLSTCTSLKLLDLRNCTTMPTLQNTSAFGHASGCVVAVPDSLYDTAQTMNVWKDITDIVWVKASEYVES